jgi:hypothetical protein
MLEAPEDLTAEHISAAVRTWWGIDPVDVDYAAVGHGSHNWIVVAADDTKWFVKADRKGEDTSYFFQSTYETAAVLRDGGLDFVHAAVRDRCGQLRREASPSWEIGVFSFIDGRNPDFHGSAAERAQIAETVGRLHAYPQTSVPALRWEPGYRQPELRHLLATKRGRAWSGGPYAQAAYDLFTASAPGIEELFALQGQLVDRIRRTVEPWVITHGVQHPAWRIGGRGQRLALPESLSPGHAELAGDPRQDVTPPSVSFHSHARAPFSFQPHPLRCRAL